MNKQLQVLEEVLQDFYRPTSPDPQLVEGILYSIQAGGKRIRPLLLLDLLEGFGLTVTREHLKVAAALEMIHTGSLIHDDLPAMDDDDYRRGHLTNHKKFGEAPAILAGDSLFLDAFAMLAQAELPAVQLVELTKALSLASGTFGMVGGQSLDMRSEGKTLAIEELQRIHQNKTGRLLYFPFLAASVLLNLDTESTVILESLGKNLGLAFQVRDDILDVTASFQELGKTPNKDEKAQKATYPAIFGLEESKKILVRLLDDIRSQLTALEAKGFQGFVLKERIEGLAIGS